MLFFKTAKQVKELTLKVVELEAEVEGLEYKKQIAKLKDDLAELKHQKKMELENIEHLTRITEEKLHIKHKRKITELVGEKVKDIADIRDKYRLKTEAALKDEKENIRGMYDEILKRLPNVNVKLTGDA